MSKMKAINDLVHELEATAHYFEESLEELKRLLSTEENQTEDTQATEPAISKEDVRKVLAEKAAAGFKTEIKALLQSYGAKNLTELDSKHYGELLEKAGGIGK